MVRGVKRNLTVNGACGVPGHPPQYYALTVLPGAMAQLTLYFSEIIGYSYLASNQRLDTSGSMLM